MHMFIPTVFLAIAAAMPVMYAGVQLEAGAATVNVEAADRWLVSISILNRGDSRATDVEVSSVSIDGALVVTPLPLKVGEISARRLVTAHVTLSNAGGIHDQQYVMNVTGAYLQAERRYPFSLRYTLSPNSNETRKPDEPPGFAAANPGPARAVPTGPVRPMPIGKETSTTNSPSAKALAPGANQVGDMSQYVSAGGITIPRDLPGVPKGRGVFLTPISLRGNPAFATLKYSGTMECTAEGRLGGGTDKFKPTQIQTNKNPDKWLTVSSFSIGKDGFLVVTDESGTSYKIKLPPILSRNSGTIEELGKTSH